MNETANQLLKALKAIRLLSSEGGRSLKQLEESLQLSKSSVYRIKDSLEEMGLRLEKDTYTHRYKLIRQPKHLQIYLSFCQEEVDVILQAIAGKTDIPSHREKGRLVLSHEEKKGRNGTESLPHTN